MKQEVVVVDRQKFMALIDSLDLFVSMNRVQPVTDVEDAAASAYEFCADALREWAGLEPVYEGSQPCGE